MGKNNKNITYVMGRILDQQIRIGSSKSDDRDAQYRSTGERRAKYIHARQTAETYCQHARQFGHWLRDRGMGHCSLQEAREHAGEYIKELPSAYSQKTARSALARVFGCRGADLCPDIADRRAEDIKRGRTLTDRAAAIERNYPDEVEVCRSTGVRKDREMGQICPRNISVREDGSMYLHLIGKGGRERDVLVIGCGREIIERDLASGRFSQDEPMYHLPSHANVHSYRADHAARSYRYAVDHGMVSGTMYRGYDKGALAFVDSQLGHGGTRYYTAVVNYLSYGRADR